MPKLHFGAIDQETISLTSPVNSPSIDGVRISGYGRLSRNATRSGEDA